MEEKSVTFPPTVQFLGLAEDIEHVEEPQRREAEAGGQVLDWGDYENLVLQDSQGDRQGCIVWESNEFTAPVRVNRAVPIPVGIQRCLGDEMNISAPDLACNRLGFCLVEVFFFSAAFHAAPWQLYTPITPVYLFMFQIFNRLENRDWTTADGPSGGMILSCRMERVEHIQSGCMNSPKKTLLYATAAMWMVWETGSRGKKSSDALTTPVCFALFSISVVAHAGNDAIIWEILGYGGIKTLIILPCDLYPTPTPPPRVSNIHCTSTFTPSTPADAKVASISFNPGRTPPQYPVIACHTYTCFRPYFSLAVFTMFWIPVFSRWNLEFSLIPVSLITDFSPFSGSPATDCHPSSMITNFGGVVLEERLFSPASTPSSVT
nr:hypothetical protein CKAN_00405200 [Ipomoea trifida]